MPYGIDVSHHQNPHKLPWGEFSGKVDFVVARACYGSELRDRRAVEHVRRARDIGAKIGIYLFYRPVHTVQKQIELFRSVADQVQLAEGDIVPVVDIEHDPIPKPGTDVSPDWAGPLGELIGRLDDLFACKVMPYITQREWGMLGRPAWVLEPSRPLWCAHYTRAPAPATPGNRSWNIWQHRVAPFELDGAGGYDKAKPELDQNRAKHPLPLLGAPPAWPIPLTPVLTSIEPDHEWDDLRDSAAIEHVAWTDLLDPPSVPPPALPGTLRRGATDRRAVMHLQTLLNGSRELRYAAPLKVDGDFGAKTEAAVKAFQRARYLHPDGIVGRFTWIHLLDSNPSPPSAA